MNTLKKFFLTALLQLASLLLFAQWKPDATYYQQMLQRMNNLITILCADSLEGREAGTAGEIKARNIIASEFEKITLLPYYSNQTYYAPFTFFQNETNLTNSSVKIGNTTYVGGKDFHVVTYTGSVTVRGPAIYANHGIVDESRNIDNYSMYEVKELRNGVFLIDLSFPKEYTFINRQDIYNYIQTIIYTAIKKDAAAIILYESDLKNAYFDRNVKFYNSRKAIPIIYANEQLRRHILKGIKAGDFVTIHINTQRKELTGYNVAGVINNNKPTTIVIGAHYDHLGYGGPISRYIGPPAIHPGADDNASGVIALMEVARYMKQSNLTNHNYVFVAFSAEEKGLWGSKAFVQDSTHFPGKIIAMINLDMVGRMDAQQKKVNILGSGTAKQWDSLIALVNYPPINTSISASGVSGSDQLSFYLHGIPVLFFITGLHKDYHTPNDKPEYINFAGIADIVIYVVNLLHHLNNVYKLDYVADDDQTQLRERSYTRGVTLGIIPDHTFGGKGVRVDDVFAGRPAAKAGMKPGDIIIRIDNQDVGDLSSYMKALSNYSEGMKAQITIIRDDKTIQCEITF